MIVRREQKRDNVVTDKPKGKGDVEFYPRFQPWEAMINYNCAVY